MTERVTALLFDHAYQIVDCHVHMGAYDTFYIPKHSSQDLINRMHAIGVKAAAVSPHLGITCDVHRGNLLGQQASVKFPGKIFTYACVNPNYPEEINDELEGAFRLDSTVGIKIHGDQHHCPLDDERYMSVYEFAQERRTVVLFHTWGIDHILQASRIAKRFDKVSFILGHAGALPDAMKLALQSSREYDNIFIDTAISMAFEGNIEWFVKEGDISKILYGSDMPFYDPCINLGRILLSQLSYGEKQAILGDNFNQITGGKCYV